MPYFIEVDNERDYTEVKLKLIRYMMSGENGVFRHPDIALVVLQQEDNYAMYKQLFHEFRIPSQMVTVRTGRRFNLSIASNILR